MYVKELEQIYDLLIAGFKLTPEVLSIYGISEETLNNMTNEGLIHLKPGSTSEYTITSINKFYLYGKKLLVTKQKRNANICFELCLKMDPTNREVCQQLLLYAIMREHYEEVMEYYKLFEQLPTTDIGTQNIYLYFINLVNTVPEEYKERVAKIHRTHSALLYKRANAEQKELNAIMSIVRKGKYKFAIRRLNDLLAKDNNYSTERLIIKEFLTQAICLEDVLKRKLVDSAKKHSYDGIIIDLDRKRNHRPLKTDELDIYELATQLLEMNRTNQIPGVLSTEGTSVSEAIRLQDYEKALSFEEEFLATAADNHQGQAPETAVYILLKQITDRIRRHNFSTFQDIPTDEDLPFTSPDSPKKLELKI